MRKRQAEVERTYEAQWDGGRGSHHPDFDPDATGDDCVKARWGAVNHEEMKGASCYRSKGGREPAHQRLTASRNRLLLGGGCLCVLQLCCPAVDHSGHALQPRD